MDSFETRYTYFLGQSPNFVLFRILKFGFSDFLLIFIKIHWNCYFSYIFQSILLILGTLISWVSPQTLFFSEFWYFDFLIVYEFSSNFHWNRYCSYNFQWIPLKLCTLIIYVSLHIFFFSVFEICIFYIFHEFSSNFPWNRYCSYSFQWIPLQLGTLILWSVFTSSSQIFRNLYFFIFCLNFHPSFIQIATAPTIFNGFLWNSHGEDGLSCRLCLKFSGAI